MRTCSDVHNYLQEQGVAHEMVHLPRPTTTAARAAELLGVPVTEIVKSLVFLVDGAPTLVLVPGDASVDTGALAAAHGARRAALASGEDVLQATGYRVGAVPPCGLASDLPIVADPGAFSPPVIYCGGGATATMLKIRSADLRRLLAPRLVEVAVR